MSHLNRPRAQVIVSLISILGIGVALAWAVMIESGRAGTKLGKTIPVCRSLPVMVA